VRIRASWVRGILCLVHVAVTSTRLPVLFPATARPTRRWKIHTTAGRWSVFVVLATRRPVILRLGGGPISNWRRCQSTGLPGTLLFLVNDGSGCKVRLSKTQTTSILAAAGAVSALLCAPAAVADPGDTACAPGQIVIDGQCNTPPAPNNAPAPPPVGTGSAPGGGDQGGHGRY
jgi:hypothetical protein